MIELRRKDSLKNNIPPLPPATPKNYQS